MDFVGFPKMPRLMRDITISEKIDGSNAQVYIENIANFTDTSWVPFAIATSDPLVMFAGSRTRWITPSTDNFGWAAWVTTHAPELWALGEGHHFGEWWGSGIQRGYGLVKGLKKFSLFNTALWTVETKPPCCEVVPVLYQGKFSLEAIEDCLQTLKEFGSVAAPDFKPAEGIVIYHTALGGGFKRTIENDDKPKGLVNAKE